MAEFKNLLNLIEKVYNSDLEKSVFQSMIDWPWPYFNPNYFNLINSPSPFDTVMKTGAQVASYNHTLFETYDYLIRELMRLEMNQYTVIDTDISSLDAWKILDNLNFSFNNYQAARPKYIRKEAVTVSAKVLLKQKRDRRKEMIKKCFYLMIICGDVNRYIPLEIRMKISQMHLMLCVTRISADEVIKFIAQRFKYEHIQFPRDLTNTWNLSLKRMSHDLYEGGTHFKIKHFDNYTRTVVAIPSYKNDMQIETFSVFRIKDLKRLADRYEGFFSEKRFINIDGEECMYATVLDYENGVHLVFFTAFRIIEHRVFIKPYLYPMSDRTETDVFACEYHNKFINKCGVIKNKRYILAGSFGQDFYQTCCPCYVKIRPYEYALNIKCKLVVLFMGEMSFHGAKHNNDYEMELYYHDVKVYNSYLSFACSTLDTIDIESTDPGILSHESDC